MAEMRRVLVITYYFPPMGLGGVQRTLKFVKYLPDFDWEPMILTVKPAGYFAFDESLLEDVPKGVEVVRTGSLDPLRIWGFLRGQEIILSGAKRSRRRGTDPPERLRSLLSRLSQAVFLPDNKIGWLPFGLVRARGLLLQGSFEILYATAPPFTCHLLGGLLKKMSGRPLVIDFRDAWTQFQFARYPTPFHLWLNQALEKQVLKAADRVVSTNGILSEKLRSRYPTLNLSKFEVITHGFDPDDFEDQGKVPPRKEFVITYTGSFWENLTPRYFLEALRELLDGRPEVEGDIKVVFVGMFRKENKKLVEDLGLSKAVEVTGYVAHSESVRYLLSSDLLWMMTGRSRGAEAVTQGKIFEYIGSGKPILACVPKGAAAQIVRSLGNSTVVAPDDVDGIKRAILYYYTKYKQGELQNIDPKIVKRYDRKRLTGELARIFDEVVAK